MIKTRPPIARSRREAPPPPANGTAPVTVAEQPIGFLRGSKVQCLRVTMPRQGGMTLRDGAKRAASQVLARHGLKPAPEEKADRFVERLSSIEESLRPACPLVQVSGLNGHSVVRAAQCRGVPPGKPLFLQEWVADELDTDEFFLLVSPA